VDQPAENPAAPYPRRGQAGDRRRDAIVVVRRPQVPGPARAMPVIAAPRGAALYRPPSGQGREEMSLDLMPTLVWAVLDRHPRLTRADHD